MPSPFPGMDPFLEVNPRWEGFHAWFVRTLAEQSLPKARDLGCWIDVERMVYQREPAGEVVLIGAPDETVAIDPSSPKWGAATSSSASVALAAPKVIHEVVLDPDAMERIKQDYLVDAQNYLLEVAGRSRRSDFESAWQTRWKRLSDRLGSGFFVCVCEFESPSARLAFAR